MSASRSWDVRRSPAKPAAKGGDVQVIARPARKGGSLKERRKKQRKMFLIAMCVLGGILLLALIYGIWRPEVRVQSVGVEGPQPEAVQRTAMSVLEGTYWYVLPRNSIFFYPESEIRTRIQEEFPEVAAVSISRTAFNEVHVSAVPRISAFAWCGETFDAPLGTCFDTDAEGLVFKMTEPERNASSTLRIFAPLDSGDPSNPIRSHVIGAQHIPDALRFVKAVRSLGVSVTAVSIRGDEADLWVPGPTRITYVLGHEEEAAILAESAFPAIEFDGSIQYIDLRFSKKVYIKRYGE